MEGPNTFARLCACPGKFTCITDLFIIASVVNEAVLGSKSDTGKNGQAKRESLREVFLRAPSLKKNRKRRTK